jgi:hypothetical protein
MHGPGPVPVTGVPATAPGRVMPGIAETGIHPALQRTLEHDLGQRPTRPPGPVSDRPPARTRSASCRTSSRSAVSAASIFFAAVTVIPPQTPHLPALSQESRLWSYSPAATTARSPR